MVLECGTVRFYTRIVVKLTHSNVLSAFENSEKQRAKTAGQQEAAIIEHSCRKEEVDFKRREEFAARTCLQKDLDYKEEDEIRKTLSERVKLRRSLRCSREARLESSNRSSIMN